METPVDMDLHFSWEKVDNHKKYDYKYIVKYASNKINQDEKFKQCGRQRTFLFFVQVRSYTGS
jgi:hypothetical protein